MEKEGEGNQVLKWLLMEFDILYAKRSNRISEKIAKVKQ